MVAYVLLKGLIMPSTPEAVRIFRSINTFWTWQGSNAGGVATSGLG
jgi:hypothetical protein